jgi:hypothetical protein
LNHGQKLTLLKKVFEKLIGIFAHKKKYGIGSILSDLLPYCETGLTFSNLYLNYQKKMPTE